MQQASSGAAASHTSRREIFNMLLDREQLRAAGQFDQADQLRLHLKGLGVTIDDENKRWRARDGRQGRRPDATDRRWAPMEGEPAAREVRIAENLARAAEAGEWTTTRCVWNILRGRAILRNHGDYTGADRLRAHLQELGLEINDKLGTWTAADGRTGWIPAHTDDWWAPPWHGQDWGTTWQDDGWEWQPAGWQDPAGPPWQRPPKPQRPPPPLTGAAQGPAIAGAALSGHTAGLAPAAQPTANATLTAGASGATAAPLQPARSGALAHQPIGGTASCAAAAAVAPIPCVLPEDKEGQRDRLAQEEAEVLSRQPRAAASFAGSAASAAEVPLSPHAGTAAVPSHAAAAACGAAAGTIGIGQRDPGRDRIGDAHADRRALFDALFHILDQDGDGLLSAVELFVCARAIARNTHNGAPMPPGADHPQSPGWLAVFQGLVAAYPGPGNGVDRAALSRIFTEGTRGPALSNKALADVLAYLRAWLENIAARERAREEQGAAPQGDNAAPSPGELADQVPTPLSVHFEGTAEADTWYVPADHPATPGQKAGSGVDAGLRRGRSTCLAR